MASSADHQHEAASQQQQQELVKLLTRHFHHQFYHMAAANAAASHHHQHPQQLPTSALAPNTNSLGLRPAASYQQRAHYQPIFGGGGGGFDLGNGVGSETGANASQQQQLQLQNQILRSQPPNSSNGNSNSNNNNTTNTNRANDTGAMNNTPLLVDYTWRNSLNPYNLPPELNLFNALGLANLNNSQQLVLNLQQQHQALLQQAAAAAAASVPAPSRQHHGPRGDSNQGTGVLNQHLSEQLEEQIRSSPTSGSYRESARESPEADGKQFLKFSINTILGRTAPASSPKPVDSIEIIKQHIEQQQKPFDGPTMVRRANQQLLDKMMMNNNIKREPKEDELLDDSSSDTSISSSINTSTTPNLASAQPQPPLHQSILFNPSNHSANSNNNNNNTSTNINTNLAHSNKIGQVNLQRQQLHHQANNGHPSLPFLNGPAAAFPWTVAARGKPRRGMMRRAVFSDSQRVGLERRFQLQKYISKPDRKKLAEKLGLRDSQVKIWFQNRRMKWRNSKERELLSAGGSREQTLPTRNNPNPDLSDVGETIKRLASTTTTTSMATTDASPNLPIPLNK